MEQAFFKYLQYEKRLSAHTLLAYQQDLTQFQTFLIEDYQEENLQDADYNLIRSWIILLVESGLEATSINRKIACLRTFYKFLQKQEDSIQHRRTDKAECEFLFTRVREIW